MSAGTRVGIILDNKWFHNRTGRRLREVVLRYFRILAFIEYPHSAFFRDWDIATSLLICVREDGAPSGHRVFFVRSKVDPRAADLSVLSGALQANGPWPADWVARTELQSELDPAEGWKTKFASPLTVGLESLGLVRLDDLFARSRRGSLEKEGGGTAVMGVPFRRTEFGPRRTGSFLGVQVSGRRPAGI